MCANHLLPWQAVEKGIANARARYQAANYSWKLAGWQHLRTQERHKLGVAPWAKTWGTAVERHGFRFRRSSLIQQMLLTGNRRRNPRTICDKQIGSHEGLNYRAAEGLCVLRAKCTTPDHTSACRHALARINQQS